MGFSGPEILSLAYFMSNLNNSKIAQEFMEAARNKGIEATHVAV